MMWQDYVFTAAAVGFLTSIARASASRATVVPRATSVPTALCVFASAAAQWTLGLRAAPVLQVLIGLCWTWIALRRAPVSRPRPFRPATFRDTNLHRLDVEL